MIRVIVGLGVVVAVVVVTGRVVRVVARCGGFRSGLRSGLSSGFRSGFGRGVQGVFVGSGAQTQVGVAAFGVGVAFVVVCCVVAFFAGVGHHGAGFAVVGDLLAFGMNARGGPGVQGAGGKHADQHGDEQHREGEDVRGVALGHAADRGAPAGAEERGDDDEEQVAQGDGQREGKAHGVGKGEAGHTVFGGQRDHQGQGDGGQAADGQDEPGAVDFGAEHGLVDVGEFAGGVVGHWLRQALGARDGGEQDSNGTGQEGGRL